MFEAQSDDNVILSTHVPFTDGLTRTRAPLRQPARVAKSGADLPGEDVLGLDASLLRAARFARPTLSSDDREVHHYKEAGDWALARPATANRAVLGGSIRGSQLNDLEKQSTQPTRTERGDSAL